MSRSSAAERRLWPAMVVAATCVLTPSAACAVTCTVSTLPAKFGVYNPLQATPTSTTGEIDVACTCSVVDCVAFYYRVELSAGSSGNAAARQMRSGSASLRYNLYSDPSYTSVWGTGSAGYSPLYLLALFGSKQVLTVYGRMPAGQMVTPASYSDAPVVTIFY